MDGENEIKVDFSKMEFIRRRDRLPNRHGPFIGFPESKISLPIERTNLKVDMKTFIVTAASKESDDKEEIQFSSPFFIQSGAYGILYRSSLVDSGKNVAIKTILLDQYTSNQNELEILRKTKHPNIIELLYFYYTTNEDKKYLNLVMEHMTDATIIFSNKKLRTKFHIKLFMYQLLRGLGYLHSMGICHRDVKTNNLLIDKEQCCDFGSAKQLMENKFHTLRISTRYYRAPELVFEAASYTIMIADMWSAGMVLGDMLVGDFFIKCDSSNLPRVIMELIGTPTSLQLQQMSAPQSSETLPHFEATPLMKWIPKHSPSSSALDLLSKLLVYNPMERLPALEACTHPFFNELRKPNACLPCGSPLPPLFNFMPEELNGVPETLVDKLIPKSTTKEASKKCSPM